MKTMKMSIGLLLLVFAVYSMIYSFSENHTFQYHYDGTVHAIQVDENGKVLDTKENRLALLNNRAGNNYSMPWAIAGGILLAIGLRVYVEGVTDE